jgi:hypothetical protein
MNPVGPSSRRLFAAALFSLLALAAGAALYAGASLKIQILGDRHVAGQPMSVRLKNDGKDPLTVCMACVGAIVDPKAPVIPLFLVETNSGGGWVSVPWGADNRNCDTTRAIQGGQSQDFLIKVRDPGVYRLKVAWITGKLSDADAHKKCDTIDAMARSKVATSQEFEVAAP